jgi:GT2 family glycosyltransferase
MIAPVRPSDCDPELNLPVKVEIIAAPVGACAQRNAIFDAAGDADIVVFFDDDFFPAPDYLALLEAEFDARPSAGIITGNVVADGILGPGIAPEEARRILAAKGTERAPLGRMSEVYKCYGCNMAINMAVLRKSAARFDEALPLYAWLEDEDFSRATAPYGDVLRSEALLGVHLGVKSGRTSGVRLGYSQIANPVYLWRKGTFPLNRAVAPICRNLISNMLKSPRPEPWIDRPGRLRGNLLAIADMLRGRIVPNRILELG